MKLFIAFVYSTEDSNFGMSNLIFESDTFDITALDMDKIRQIEAEIGKSLPVNVKDVRIINYKVI